MYAIILEEVSEQGRKRGNMQVTCDYESKYENGVEVTYIDIAGDYVPGIAVEIPGTGKRVLQIKCRNGLLLCGLFSPEKIDGIDFAACVFSAPEFSDMLMGKPLFVSSKAKEMGVTEAMSGREIAELFNGNGERK